MAIESAIEEHRDGWTDQRQKSRRFTRRNSDVWLKTVAWGISTAELIQNTSSVESLDAYVTGQDHDDCMPGFLLILKSGYTDIGLHPRGARICDTRGQVLELDL